MPTADELREAACWEQVDRVGGPEVTDYKQRLRLRQARWRKSNGLPIGRQRQRDGGTRPIGSRIGVEHTADDCNFLTDAAAAAVERRLASPEPHQTLNVERLRFDCLSSMPLCFNLFGELWADAVTATTAIRTWWPDTPGVVDAVRFEWSPRRLDPAYLGNRSAFDVAFELGLPGGTKGVIGVETKYHEHSAREPGPSDERLARYEAVSQASGVFQQGSIEKIVGTDLQQIWLDHLLALSMLQHPDWEWARFVLAYPAENVSFADAAARYRALLADDATFRSITFEEMLGADGAIPVSTAEPFRERYLRD